MDHPAVGQPRAAVRGHPFNSPSADLNGHRHCSVCCLRGCRCHLGNHVVRVGIIHDLQSVRPKKFLEFGAQVRRAVRM